MILSAPYDIFRPAKDKLRFLLLSLVVTVLWSPVFRREVNPSFIILASIFLDEAIKDILILPFPVVIPTPRKALFSSVDE
ncbi:hypothetical protein DSECCO2_635560 [anaerobic digester metagenome]